MGCGELETAIRLNLPVTFVVVSNAVYGWIKAGQDSGFGKRYYNVDFDRTDHAAVARAFGVAAFTVEDPADLVPVLRKALDHDGPSLVDVVSQPLHEAAAPVSEWVAGGGRDRGPAGGQLVPQAGSRTRRGFSAVPTLICRHRP